MTQPRESLQPVLHLAIFPLPSRKFHLIHMDFPPTMLVQSVQGYRNTSGKMFSIELAVFTIYLEPIITAVMP